MKRKELVACSEMTSGIALAGAAACSSPQAHLTAVANIISFAKVLLSYLPKSFYVNQESLS